MQHLGTAAEMDRMLNDLARTLPKELRAELISQCSVEERLRGLNAEERLQGLNAEERRRLFELLRQPDKKKPKRGKKS